MSQNNASDKMTPKDVIRNWALTSKAHVIIFYILKDKYQSTVIRKFS